MAADLMSNVHECTKCAKNRIFLMNKRHTLTLFPIKCLLNSVAIDIHWPLPNIKTGFVFILVIATRFKKLTQIVLWCHITVFDVMSAFTEHMAFKDRPPQTLLSDKGQKFVAKFSEEVCHILGVTNTFKTINEHKRNGQVERFNRTLTAMLRGYDEEKPKN